MKSGPRLDLQLNSNPRSDPRDPRLSAAKNLRERLPTLAVMRKWTGTLVQSQWRVW